MLRTEMDLAKLRETERANKAQEELKGREIRTKAATDLFGSVVKGLGGFKFKPKNDWSWHGKLKEIEEAALANFNFVRGAKLPSGVSSRNVKGAVITYTPTLGTSSLTSSKISGYSLATTQIYNLLRGTGGYNPVYDSGDIGKYLFAVESPALILVRAIRAYKAVVHYNNLNDIEGGRAMLSAMGYDYDACVLDLGNAKNGLIAAIASMGTIPYPRDIHVIDRHMYLESAIFKDDVGERANIIIPTFNSLPIYNEEAAAVWFDTSYGYKPGAGKTIVGDIGTFVALFNIVRYNDDFKSIISDFRNYGRKNGEFLRILFDGASIEGDVPIIYDEDFLSTWNNMNFAGQLARFKIDVADTGGQPLKTFEPGYQIINKEFVFSMVNIAGVIGSIVDTTPTEPYSVWSADSRLSGCLSMLQHVYPTLVTCSTGSNSDHQYVWYSLIRLATQTSYVHGGKLDALVTGSLYADSDHKLTPSETVYATLGKFAKGSIMYTDNTAASATHGRLKVIKSGIEFSGVSRKITDFSIEELAPSVLPVGPYSTVSDCSTELWNECILLNVDSHGDVVLATEKLSNTADSIITPFIGTLAQVINTNASHYEAQLNLLNRTLDFWRFPPQYECYNSWSTDSISSASGFISMGGVMDDYVTNDKLKVFHTTEMCACMQASRVATVYQLDLLSMLSLDVAGNMKYDTAN